jgi:hypothetical protein
MDHKAYPTGGNVVVPLETRRFGRGNVRCACRACGAHAMCVSGLSGMSGRCHVCGGADLAPVPGPAAPVTVAA